MEDRLSKNLFLALAAILIIGTFLPMFGNAESRVEYALTISDSSGDSKGIPGLEDKQAESDADILEITSKQNGENIVLTMKVAGTIHVYQGTYVGYYSFNLDVNGDDQTDWVVQSSGVANSGGTHTSMVEDEETAESWPTIYYLENGTGDGNDTLTLTFPISHITDIDTIESWNMYGSSTVVIYTSSIGYTDFAPEEGFGGGSGGGSEDDADGDGMDDTWESAYGLNPSDPSDADEDLDGDGYSNIDEHDANTDPTDPTDYPGSNGGGSEYDADDDGMDDAWEIAYGLDPSDSSDADEDMDGDGYTNLEEYEAFTDPGDDSDYPDGNGGNGGSDYDPSKETPTDTSISVAITTFKYSVEEVGDNVTVDILIEGTTSGVDHCEFLVVNYYSDGSKESEDDWTGEYNQDDEFGVFHFEGKDSKWKEWELKIKTTMPKNQWDDDDDDMTKFDFYVRAYADSSEDNWNQAKKTYNVAGGGDGGDGGKKKDDEGGFLPGFESIIMIVSMAMAMAVIKFAWRKKF